MPRFNSKEIFSYIFWGIITTIINLAAYFLLRINNILSVQIAAVLAWFISVLAAFISNKYFVFKSSGTDMIIWFKEGGLFFISRVFSGILDVVLISAAVHYSFFTEKISKVIVNVIIIAVNYLASKIIIFRKKIE
jgi:putative flippase GtrA